MNDGMHTPFARSGRSAIAMIVATTATIIVGTGAVLAVRDRLPDPIATRWGPDGAEGFQSLAVTLWLAAGLLTGLGVLFATVLIKAAPPGRHRLTAILAGVVIGLGVGVYAAVIMQAGMDDARHTSGPLPAIAVGVVTGIAGGWIIPRLVLRSGR